MAVHSQQNKHAMMHTIFRNLLYLAPLLLIRGASANPLYNVLGARQTSAPSSGADYLTEVCFPNVTAPIVPPCQLIINIQSACLPNGTSPLDLLAHAECMCGGSFFEDWIGCLDCNYIHGQRTPDEVSAFHTILSTVSNELCTGTPTADFADLFSSQNYNPQETGTGAATQTTDLYPSQTAVSLYYTPSGAQGPGQITGSATAATKAVVTVSGSGSGSGSAAAGNTGGSSKATGATAATGSAGSTSSSKAGAAPTGIWVGAFGVVAGGMVMAAF